VLDTLNQTALNNYRPADLSPDIPARPVNRSRSREATACFHCGEPCPDDRFSHNTKVFCCQGCLFVHDLLAENGLDQFYRLESHPGVRVKESNRSASWSFLDDAAMQLNLLDFTDGKTSRITFHIPGIHCIACVWLLENLFRVLPGVGASQVNFPRREVSITFAKEELPLSHLVRFLASIGYEPELNFGQLTKPTARPSFKKIWLQIGLAGFAFGNIMLFSLPAYLGLDAFSGPAFRSLFGYLGLVLSAPVLIYSAADYWRAAWVSVRQRRLSLEVPIAVGLAALYGQSVFEVLAQRGDGYADSLAGLVFFLLCGRAFQQKTFDRISFDRDFKSFFPLSVRRKTVLGEETIALVNLRVGDRLLLRNGELIPADARLVDGCALVDYSFVTGESEPVTKTAGDYLYAGGKQVGGAVEVQTTKPVSQSYLTSLWNHEAFRKERSETLNTLTDRYSRRFTRAVLGIACCAAVFWALSGNSERAIKAFTSVLIVACPCALALAAPFGLGTAQRLLGGINVFLKNALVLERLAEVNTLVFDKTGTLTAPHSSNLCCDPAGTGELTATERAWISTLASSSTHPHSRRIADELGGTELGVTNQVLGFTECPGLGISGQVEGHQIHLGSNAWLQSARVSFPSVSMHVGAACSVAVDGHYRGSFLLSSSLRPETDTLLAELGRKYELALLSGDNEKERFRFAHLFGNEARLRFNQSPLDKLTFIEDLRKQGKVVMMVGDGLNDAGALKRSDVGVAVVEKIGVFSPASDIILEADQVPHLSRILAFARISTRVVRASFLISSVYNVLGITIAAAGILSPLICAVLMPLSSITVVLFACGMTRYAAKRAGIDPATPFGSKTTAASQSPTSVLFAAPEPALRTA
jgi:P-type Cu+ transporter